MSMIRLSALMLLAGSTMAVEGPGPGGWQFGDPAKYGLSAKRLQDAAMEVHDVARIRNCTIIVKNGEIVLEAYDRYSNVLSNFESDSMGKTATAAMVGLLVHKGLADLDTPIYKYGVTDDKADWNETGVDFFPQLTLRHLISQATGYGRVAPGSFFTYDSDAYIQYISYTIAACTGEEPTAWISREFAGPLGIPTLWNHDGLPDGDFSCGGGQLYTCRDAARVGQLVVQGGLWKDADGKPLRLYSEEFSKQFLYPSYPKNNAAYGFLTWLNTDVTKVPDGVNCCAPRWGHAAFVCKSDNPKSDCTQCCATRALNDTTGHKEIMPVAGAMCNENSTTLCESDADASIPKGEPRNRWMRRVGSALIKKQMIGDNIEGTTPAPGDLGVAMGLFARYIMMIPSMNITVISIGAAEGWAENCWGGYDDSYTAGLLWNALAPALSPKAAGQAADYLDDEATRAPLRKKMASTMSFSMASEPASAHRALAANTPAAPRSAAKKQHARAAAGTKWAGSCVCYCQSESGRGRCLNVAASAAPSKFGRIDASGFDEETCSNIPNINDRSNKKSFMFQQGRYCSPLGTPKQCRYPADKHADLCANKYSDGTSTTVQERACAPVAGQVNLATATCVERSLEWSGGGCYWSNSTCDSRTGEGSDPFYFPPADAYYGEK